jgi:hypothetical protein
LYIQAVGLILAFKYPPPLKVIEGGIYATRQAVYPHHPGIPEGGWGGNV